MEGTSGWAGAGSRGHRGRALAAALAGLAGAFVTAVAVVPPAQASGSVSLFDDSGGAAVFTGAPMAPGHVQTGCVSVSAAGAAATDAVVMSAADVSGTLAPYLTVTVDVGTGGHLGDCSGWVVDASVPQWSGRLGDLVPGVVTGWRPGASATRTFRISVEVDDVGAAAGTTAAGRFVWQLTTAPPPPPPPPPSPTPTATPSPTPTATPTPTPTTTPTPTATPTTTPTATPTTTPTAAPTTRPPDPVPPTTAPPVTQQPGEPTTQPTAEPAPATDPVPPSDPGVTGTAAPAPTPTPTPSPTPAGELPGDGSGAGGTDGAGPDGAAGGQGGTGGGAARSRQPVADVVLGVPLTVVRETARRVSEVAMHIAEQPQYPLGVLSLVAVFLLVQDLIDRRDPKLAVARVTGRDSTLRFPDLFPPGGRA